MHIGYLGPEIPALSATFVYREILGLRQRGHQVAVYSVKAPASPARDVDLGEVITLYSGGVTARLPALTKKAERSKPLVTVASVPKTLRQNALQHLHREFSLDVNLTRLEAIFDRTQP